MKKVRIVFPSTKAEEVADIMGTNQFVNLCSFTVNTGLFDNSVCMWVAFPEGKDDTVVAKLGSYIKK